MWYEQGLTQDVGAQIKISKNQTKICSKNAVIRRLLIFSSSNEHHLVAIFM